MTIKSALICATAIAIALTSFDLRPAAASDGAGIAQQSTRLQRGAQAARLSCNPAVPLAAFGAVMGVVGGIAAANSRRDYYTARRRTATVRPRTSITSGRCISIATITAAGAAPAASLAIAARTCNVPGPTNYGNAAGQNGQAPPASPANSQSAGGSN